MWVSFGALCLTEMSRSPGARGCSQHSHGPWGMPLNAPRWETEVRLGSIPNHLQGAWQLKELNCKAAAVLQSRGQVAAFTQQVQTGAVVLAPRVAIRGQEQAVLPPRDLGPGPPLRLAGQHS